MEWYLTSQLNFDKNPKPIQCRNEKFFRKNADLNNHSNKIKLKSYLTQCTWSPIYIQLLTILIYAQAMNALLCPSFLLFLSFFLPFLPTFVCFLSFSLFFLHSLFPPVLSHHFLLTTFLISSLLFYILHFWIVWSFAMIMSYFIQQIEITSFLCFTLIIPQNYYRTETYRGIWEICYWNIIISSFLSFISF